ncbi:MAG: hypothetical protein PHX38_07830 [Sulfuricella sp.]|nr:hypothetical protein [Sulfuricella sp.]
MVGPLFFGIIHLGRARFLALNLAGALLWAMVVGGAGYLFGSLMELLFADMRHYEEALFGLMAGVGFAVWLAHRWRQRRR